MYLHFIPVVVHPPLFTSNQPPTKNGPEFVHPLPQLHQLLFFFALKLVQSPRFLGESPFLRVKSRIFLHEIHIFRLNSSGWWYTYPSEKYELVGMMKFPTEWKIIKFHGSKAPTSPYFMVFDGLPSGKLLHNYGKSPCFMGRSTRNGHFQ